jgi:hypothetical protein
MMQGIPGNEDTVICGDMNGYVGCIAWRVLF